MGPSEHKGLQVLWPTTQAEWEAWLIENGASVRESIWVAIAKKGSGCESPSYEQVREEALRYGWVDSLPNKHDEKYYFLRLTKRHPKSVWSKINVRICEELIASGRIPQAGMVEVERAKKDGRWYAAY